MVRQMPSSRSRGSEPRIKRLSIRVPESLYSALGKAAAREMRSVSDYIVVELKKSTEATLSK